MALQAGVNPKVVSERLGHSGIAITLDTYSHVTEPMQTGRRGRRRGLDRHGGWESGSSPVAKPVVGRPEPLQAVGGVRVGGGT